MSHCKVVYISKLISFNRHSIIKILSILLHYNKLIVFYAPYFPALMFIVQTVATRLACVILLLYHQNYCSSVLHFQIIQPIL